MALEVKSEVRDFCRSLAPQRQQLLEHLRDYVLTAEEEIRGHLDDRAINRATQGLAHEIGDACRGVQLPEGHFPTLPLINSREESSNPGSLSADLVHSAK